MAPPRLPLPLARWIGRRKAKSLVDNMADYGLPTPDHEPLDAHPAVSGEFLTRVGSGDIAVKPAIARLDGAGALFTDGSREVLDAIICATGDNIEFPFLSPDDARVTDNHIPLYKRMVQAEPALHGLWFMGLAQTIVAEEKRHQGHYYASRRHTMQVNFEPYVADLAVEIRRGAKRKTGRSLAA